MGLAARRSRLRGVTSGIRLDMQENQIDEGGATPPATPNGGQGNCTRCTAEVSGDENCTI